MDSLELDPPSLGDNMASPYTGSNRKLSQSTEYHSDTIIVNDLVASRVRINGHSGSRDLRTGRSPVRRAPRQERLELGFGDSSLNSTVIRCIP